MSDRPLAEPESLAGHEPAEERVVGSTLVVATLMLQAALWWRAVHWYPRLPDRIPVHFDASGAPDRWTERNAVEWFLLPGLSLGLLGLLLGIGLSLPWLARHAPELINVPHKRRFLALPPRSRIAALAPTRTYMAWTAALLGAMFLWMVEGSARVATGAASRLAVWPTLLVVGVILLSLIPYAIASRRCIDRMVPTGDQTKS
jgi:uncharacterized membrane protein